MKAILRSAVLAAGVAAGLAASMMPAQASGGAVAFQGTAHINCFGCGSSPGTASLSGAGVVNGTPANGSASASYTAFEGTGATCVVTGTATGSVTGVVNVSFNWTRVGASAVITTSGDINGAGTAAFAVTSPAGIPCGSAVDAVVVGAVAGT